MHYELEITFEEAVFGGEKEISFPRTEACKKCKGSGSSDGKINECDECNGTGQVRKIQRSVFGMVQQVIICRKCHGTGKKIINPCKECNGNGLVSNIKTLKIKIPKGIDNGNQIRIVDEGEINREGKNPGDLYISFYVEPHKFFRREDNDIYMETKIPFIKAILGGELKIPTLEKETILKIPSGTQSHTVFRLTGFGVPFVDSNREVGDQYVKVIVDIPKKVNRKQRELLERFEELNKKKFGLF